jgi:hypothetical protein
MPLYDRSQAKESGFAQVRDAMVAFEGDVVAVEEGQWGQSQYDREANRAPKEFIEVKCMNVKVLEVTEELSMIPTEWDFRVNTSMSKNSFWVEMFLKSADDNKVLLPAGIIHKRILWKKASMPYKIRAKGDEPEKEGNSTNFIIEKVIGDVGATPKVAVKVASKSAPAPVAAPVSAQVDLMAVAIELAVGKTEEQFRDAASKHPQFAASPLLPLAVSGGITQALLNGKKLKMVDNLYQKV